MFQVPCVWRLPLCRRPPLLDAQLKSRPHAVVVDQAVVAVLAAAVDHAAVAVHAAVVRCADDVEKENVAAVPDFFRESGRALNGRVSVAAAVVDAAAEAVVDAVADVAVDVVVDVAAEAVARSFAASLPAVAPEVAAVDVAVVDFSIVFAAVEVARQRQH